jgi:lipopolysaccharide transport system ATP-binding protein
MSLIRVHDVSKAYRRYGNRWARLAEWLWPWQKKLHVENWVLRDINFEILPGESVAIVGANGAGKSTLLKIITGTTQTTTGSVQINGRITALLELGMGFHPDFTGRQNVFMAGQLIGLSREEIAALLPDIQAFAGLGNYFEQPLRTYSSGMQMRLAFSLATAKRPDLLIIDEALSVGDAFFQHKSFARIRQFKEQGTSLLIVSHDRSAIQAICDRAILLQAGAMVKQGAPEDVMDYYHAILADNCANTVRQIVNGEGVLQTISGSGEAVIDTVRLFDREGNAVDAIEVGTFIVLEVVVNIRVDIPRLVLGYMIKDALGQSIYGINTHRLNKTLENLRAGETIKYRIEFPANLGWGSYSIALALSSVDSHIEKNYEWRDRCLIFQVYNQTRENFIGCNWLNADITVSRHETKIDRTFDRA